MIPGTEELGITPDLEAFEGYYKLDPGTLCGGD